MARNLLSWFEDTLVVDGHFFQTMVRVRVSDNGTVVQDHSRMIPESLPLARFTHWAHSRKVEGLCRGKTVRGICTYSLFSLHKLFNKTQLFLNKFNLEVDASAVGCMLERAQRG